MKLWKKAWQNRKAKCGLILLFFLILLAVIIPVCSPYAYDAQDISVRNIAPSASHLFGTDKFGRDLFVRVFFGARISLFLGFCSAAINTVIGIAYGAFSGYTGGKTDFILTGAAEVLYAIPSMLYMILMMLLLGGTVYSMLLGLCISQWIGMARIVRGQVIILKGREYVLAAKAMGASAFQVILFYILPNAIGPIVSQAVILVPQAIFAEAFLSFVGIGIAPPAASLGTLAQEARAQMELYPWQMFFPVIVLCLLLIALYFIEEGIQNSLHQVSEIEEGQ